MVAPDGPGLVYVALDAVVAVRPEPGAGAAASGDRAVATDLVLLDVLAAAAPDRPRVQLLARGGTDVVAGELVAVGADVVSVRLDGDRRAACFVAAQSLAVALFTSG